METHFSNDEGGYRDWVGRHPGGIVVNRLPAGMCMVHVADCPHIAWFPPRASEDLNYTKGDGKWCFLAPNDAEDWIRVACADFKRCLTCEPELSVVA